MLSSPSISIYLDSPEAILYGGPSEASGSFITGRVVVATKHVAQLASLTVTLRPQRPRMFQSLYPVTPDVCLQSELVSSGCTAPQIVHRDISDREHEWRFSIGVPGSTAETVFSNDNYVAYELIAHARAPASLTSAMQSKAVPVAIKRAPAIDSQWALLASEPISENAVWRNQLDMTLIAQSRIVYDEQALSVRGVIRPLVKGLSLVRAGFQLTERVSHSISALGRAHSFATSKVIVDNSVDMPSPHSTKAAAGSIDVPSEHAGLPLIQEICASRCLPVPVAYTGIQYDIRRGPIRVSHELSLFVTVIDTTGRAQNLRLATPVFIMPMSTRIRIELPRYEETAADELIESGLDAGVQRDEDVMSEYVLVDTTCSNEPDNMECHSFARSALLVDEALDSCPLALDGYQCLDDDVPPPPAYPGAGSTEVERTLVAPGAAFLGQDPARTNRIRKLCSRALLRAQAPTPKPLPPLPPQPPRHADSSIAGDALLA
ncbi:hypothetical protein GGF42_000794 [Coemansia sp. RSA 2424]|nr:hypothetical protein GGF42_000794 [Coemansia sp. RSA 2424]